MMASLNCSFSPKDLCTIVTFWSGGPGASLRGAKSLYFAVVDLCGF